MIKGYPGVVKIGKQGKGSMLDLGHPLARNLKFLVPFWEEAGPEAFDMATRRTCAWGSTKPGFTEAPLPWQGMAISCGASTSLISGPPSNLVWPENPVGLTLAALVRPTSTSAAGRIMIFQNATSSKLGFRTNQTAGTIGAFYRNGSGTGVGLDVAVTNNAYVLASFTMWGALAGNLVEYYLDGVLKSTATDGSISQSTNVNSGVVAINNAPAGGAALVADVAGLWAWAEPWGAGNHKTFAANVWAMLRPSAIRTYTAFPVPPITYNRRRNSAFIIAT